ncbi:MAG TPA: capsule assembly Wzi family protein [Terriglobales bacterium]|nr:capsule assembly Wzi family protein [Terriglobales bacterium]
MPRFSTVLLAASLILRAPAVWSQDTGDHDSTEVAATNASQTSPPINRKTLLGVEDAVPGNSSRTGFAGHIADFIEDQKQLWTVPLRARLSDATWLVPLGGVTAGLFVTDRQYSRSLSQNAATLRHYKTLSDVGVAGLIGGGAGLYLLSFPTHNEHWRETGFLAGEAALNSLVTTEALKYSFRRERPYQANGAGSFFKGGTSFPSEHAAAAWSIAGVVAHEYEGTLPRLFAYGMASAVSFSRVRAHQHFPSDVLVGSVLGYLVSQSVYSRRHDPEVGGAAFESPREAVDQERMRIPSFMGSPYVPLDSWIYPALERLAALGYVKTASLGMRPWTRIECTRLLGEASELQADEDTPLEVQRLYDALAKEFAADSELMSGERNFGAHLESVYSRSLVISGKPLTDNLHFGQTLLNDYGRPYQQGFNAVAGTSGWTTTGPFVVYVRGEYQSAPSAPSPSPAVLDFISGIDGLPPNPPLLPVAAINRFQLLDAYVAMNLANWQISFGRRSLWWGPSEGGAMALTNNAAPLNNMFSVDRVSPFRLPWLFRYLGDMRFAAFLGRMEGQQFLAPDVASGVNGPPIGQYGHSLNPQPFFSGGKLSFKLTQNFEFGISKTTIYGGPGNPLTLETLIKSTLGARVNGSHLGYGQTFADFVYRIPKLRDWLSFYGEAFSKDEPSPIPYMRKSAFQGGLYFAKLPAVPRLDLRLEGGSTVPYSGYFCTSCFYVNGEFLDGYTNGARLMGSWIGRAAQGELMQTNYWLSPKRKIGLELRHRKVDQQYLPQGGTQNDIAVNADIFTGPGFRFSGNLQYERWQIPLLATSRQNNLAASFEFGFWPIAHSH